MKAPRARPLSATRMRALVKRVRPLVVDAGRSVGYACAFHGSLLRDIDVIAAPWTDDAVSPAELAEVIATAVGGFTKPSREHDPVPREKPHGRLGFPIYVGGTYIDLSVLPLHTSAIR
jgi:hypothetical protein